MEAGRNLARGRWLSRYAAEIAAMIVFAIVIIIVGSLAPRMLVAAEGTQVNAEVNFEISKLAVKHSEGTLLRAFNVNFVPVNPDLRPWYARF